jgi:hypothetical protein
MSYYCTVSRWKTSRKHGEMLHYTCDLIFACEGCHTGGNLLPVGGEYRAHVMLQKQMRIWCNAVDNSRTDVDDEH